MIKKSDFAGTGVAMPTKTRGREAIFKLAKAAIPIFSMLLYASASWGQTTLFSETFTASNGTTSSSQWGLDMTGCSVNGSQYLKVQSNQMQARGPSCDATWNSITFDISGYVNVSLSANLSESGTLESSDRLQMLYSIDGGAFQHFATNGDLYDDFTSATASQTGLSGNTLAIRFIASSNTPQEYYYVDDILVVGTPTPLTPLALSGTNPTCYGANNGSLTVTGVPPIVGACATPTTSPYNCNSCTQTLTGSGWNTINAGTVACIPVGQSYTGGLSINGGTVIVCGTLAPSSLNLNSGILAVNGTLNFNGWFSVNGSTQVYNYGTTTISGGAGLNAPVYNYGTMSIGSGIQINSSGAFTNNGTLQVTGNYDDNNGTTNNGTITVTGNFTRNSGTAFTNNCTITIGGSLTSNGPINQNGTMAATGALTVNGNGGLNLGGGSLTSAASATLNGPINNTNSTCARVNIAGNTTINGSGSISGKTDYCDANGIETNWGHINSPATTNCSCGATGAGGLAITYAWSTGSSASSLTGLAAGTYTLTATGGGYSRVMSKTITSPTQIVVTPTPTDATVGNNGRISLAVSGGTSPYTYAWSNGATTKDISSLAANTYTVTVTDATGCTATSSSVINPPSGPCTCIASGNWTNPAIWSGNCTGGDGKYGGQGDTVVINGYHVTIDSAHTAKAIIMIENGSGVSRFTYTGTNRLTVLNDVNITTSGTGGNVEIEIQGSATMHVLGNMVIDHNKGANVTIKLNSTTGNDAKLQIDGDLRMIMGTGSGDLFIHSYAANDTVLVKGNVLFDNNNTSSTADMIITQNSSSKLIVGGDINFDGVRNQNMELILNDNSVLELGGSIIRQASPKKFGMITMSGSSLLVFNGAAPQVWEGTTGNTDNNTYKTIVVNNTSAISPQIVLNGDVTLTGTLSMQKGNIGTGMDMLILTNTSASALSGHSENSYVVGTLRRYIASNAASYEFPLGYGAASEYYWAKITNNYMVGPTYLTATFGELPTDEKGKPINVADEGELFTEINQVGIWTIDPNIQPILGSYSIEVNTSNIPGLVDGQFRLVKRPTKSGRQSWGNGNVPLGLLNQLDKLVSSGKTSLKGLTSFSDFGVGQGTGGSLPIDLVSFEAEVDGSRVRLDWVVSMEINNDYFTIERSFDGLEFEQVLTVKGGGSHSMEKKYQAFDEQPHMGLSYYRLKQTDFDGVYKVYDMVSVTMKSSNAHSASISFDIVPNPNKGQFTLKLETPFDQTKVTVFNYVGQIVYHNDLINTSGKTQTPLDIGDDLALGVYIVKIDTGKETFMRHMVID